MRIALLCALVLVAACDREDADDTAMDSTAMAPAMTAADLAGTWTFTVMPMDVDSVVAAGQFIAAGDPIVFTMELPDRDPMTATVTVDGDSVMITNGPYQSVLRDNVMVTTNGTYHMVDGRLEGIVTAHYAGVTTADSVVRLRSTMTRGQ